jgi:hypothetical protein
LRGEPFGTGARESDLEESARKVEKILRSEDIQLIPIPYEKPASLAFWDLGSKQYPAKLTLTASVP